MIDLNALPEGEVRTTFIRVLHQCATTLCEAHTEEYEGEPCMKCKESACDLLEDVALLLASDRGCSDADLAYRDLYELLGNPELEPVTTRRSFARAFNRWILGRIGSLERDRSAASVNAILQSNTLPPEFVGNTPDMQSVQGYTEYVQERVSHLRAILDATAAVSRP